ncbi:ras-specific guanine nucleotide-releasing factor RalGPS2-like [Oppia nitens]|uniref:ras-specific guanine nucleotide-releasing factor RalGPS2-like n=1 Tax=Oppia nitens TaxID=1686743 RepID=UPI0023DADCD1|nr:ras-specific guanine nucleotide-releasing factor RalGPS2-like [Oppia nitens]
MSSLNVKPFPTIKRSVSTPGTLLFNWRSLNSEMDRMDSRFQLLSTTANSGSSPANSSHTSDSQDEYHSLTTPDIVRNKSVDYYNWSPINTFRLDVGDYHSKYDNIHDVLRVAPDDLATQLTLIDLAIFVDIRSEELSSCQWNGSKKLQISPNVVKFTQRFNRVSFWVIKEILEHKSAKHRAEVLSHFLKVAKRLHDLNNLHSAFAITSALSSAPIHRLSKTWTNLSKKDKQLYERLNELFSSDDNFDRLRDHLSHTRNPCIPYLGLYLTDITHIDVAHPLSKGKETPNRKHKMDSVLNTISEFQKSVYDNLPIMPNLQKYLLSVRYIEELQRFLEEDNFKKSLSLEPPETDGKSVFYVRELSQAGGSQTNSTSGDQSTLQTPLSHSGTNNRLSVSFNCADTHANANSMPTYSKRIPFIAGHRKSHSLGTNVLSTITSAIPSNTKYLLSTHHSDVENKKNICLIDDSPLIEEPVIHKSRDITEQTVTVITLPTIEIIYDDEELTELRKDVVNDYKQYNRYIERNIPFISGDILLQGMVKRKTILKDGKKPSMAGWVKYWLILQGNHLYYFDSKQFKTYQTDIFPSNPLKCRSLIGWSVSLFEDTQYTDTFRLSDNYGKNMYKFRAPTPGQAYEWFKKISQVVAQFKCRQQPIDSLIDFCDDSINCKNYNYL